MDKQEIIAEISAAALLELEKLQQRHIKVSSPVEIVKEVFRGLGDPKPAEKHITPASLAHSASVPLVVIPPDFPRLLVNYGGKTLEYAVVRNYAEWSPLHHWYTIFPPQQPASREVTTTLEAEIEKLRAEGAQERPREEHERRRQTKGYTQEIKGA